MVGSSREPYHGVAMTTHAWASSPLRAARDLVALPTESACSNLALIDDVAAYLRSLGIDHEIQRDAEGRKANLVARIGPSGDGGLMIAGHTDVVPVADQAWTRDPYAPDVKDGRLYGRGSCDMKGFLGAALAVVPEIAKRRLAAPVLLVLTYDEEVGCHGARRLVPELVRIAGGSPRLCLVGEPTEMKVVDGHKGMRLLRTVVQGRAAHSSRPDLGLNALVALSRIVSMLDALAAELRGSAHSGAGGPVCEHSTINVGRIHGGAAINIVAEHAVMDWELRHLPDADPSEILARLRALEATLGAEGFTVQTLATSVLPGLSPRGKAAWTRHLLELCQQAASHQLDYCTEAGLYQEGLGTPTLVCGPGSVEQAHRPDEFVTLGELDRAERMIMSLVVDVCELTVDTA